MEHGFSPTTARSVGLEEELLLVDESTHRLAHEAEDVLAAVGETWQERGLMDHEAYAAEIELRSPPCADVVQATHRLRDGRHRLREVGATLMGCGVHPTAELGDVRVTRSPRYARVRELVRDLIARTPDCALHVHVGMPDPESALRAFNGMRLHLPLLQGLAANSPWWFGRDSGLASARFSLLRAFPGRGVPDAFSEFEQYVSVVERVAEAAAYDDYTYVWWDVRLHPRLGTIEVREMDAQSSLDDVAALGALVHALAVHESEQPARPNVPPREAIAASSFRASRDGLDASILHDGHVRPLREVARAALEVARPSARELGCDAPLEEIERMLAEGNGAVRRRRASARGGVGAMLGEIVQETHGALAPSGRPAASPWGDDVGETKPRKSAFGG
jgi:glutamate---cysteine ligase / carboxylate-amine ligase